MAHKSQQSSKRQCLDSKIPSTSSAFQEPAMKTSQLVFEITDGVQLFFIDENTATMPGKAQKLQMLMFVHDDDDKERVFMKVADWIYPLFPSRCPTLHSEYGAYIFSNPTAEKPNLCVGLLFPSDLDETNKSDFESILQKYTVFDKQEVGLLERHLSVDERQRLSTKIAAFLMKTGEACAWGVSKSSELGNAYLVKKADQYIAKQTRCIEPTEIDSRVQFGAQILRKGTNSAVDATGYVVSGIGNVAWTLGELAAKKIEEQLAAPEGESSKAAEVFDNTIEVFGGGISGAASIWHALENSARVLAKSIANETVDIVDVRYGDQAATLADNTLHAVGNTTLAAYYIDCLGTSTIAERSAVIAGIGALSDLGVEVPATDAIAVEGGTNGNAIEDEKGTK